MLRSAGLLLLAIGSVGAAAAAAVPPQPGPVDVQVTSELTTGSQAEPSGVPIRQTTLRLLYRGSGWTAQAELPSLRVAGLPDAPRPRALASRDVDEGSGDARLTFSVPLRAATRDASAFDLVAQFKSGTGHAVGGMPAYDASQSLGVAWQRPAGPWKLFAYAGWRRAGDLPGDAPGRHALAADLGVSHQLTPRLQLGGSFDVRQRMATDPAVREATLHAAFTQGERRWLLHVGQSVAPQIHGVWAGLSLRTQF